MTDHRGIGREPIERGEVVRMVAILALVVATALAALWSAPTADDALAAIEREREQAAMLDTLSRIDSLTSVAWERDRRYSVERMLEDTTEALRDCRVERARLEASP